MSRYLSEAAEVLKKADAANDKALVPQQEIRLKIANGFATLAAIDNGLLPAEVTQDVIAAVVARHTA
ncbi:hypothetical protein KEF29_03290 [Streptomyces tuirus]|uniref:Uncharacterized protein n=1 Tax=Streptomyces tuirus TaxID=68278 RepID=A0A941F8A5_9ACTN|nr:hypothetical protein [Streptomyces tuirus]